MNDWNPLDLRKFKPRQPSPELRARIFATEQSVGAIAFDLRELTRWLVPAFGCFLLVLGSLSHHWNPRYAVDLASTNLVLPSLDEEHPSVLPPPSAHKHSGVNGVPAKTLEWNYRPHSAVTSMGTILISYTNKLIQ